MAGSGEKKKDEPKQTQKLLQYNKVRERTEVERMSSSSSTTASTPARRASVITREIVTKSAHAFSTTFIYGFIGFVILATFGILVQAVKYFNSRDAKEIAKSFSQQLGSIPTYIEREREEPSLASLAVSKE